MGITGLLPLLRSIHKHTTLKKFAGQTLGIDGYGWLHRGSVACAIELALDKPTTKYLEFAVNRVRMLLDFGITPYLVFDGDALPSKAGTNQERRDRRNEARQRGLSLYRAGKISQAYQELQKAATVTPQMARLLIDELQKMDVQYIVAPYEADAQLVYLEQQGIINGIISEDSDLLVFGTKRLITKLNQYGECVEIERKDFPLVKEISLSGWTDDMFRRMAILSGCDYLPNIDKMGLKTAYRFIRKFKDPEKVLKMVAFEGKFCVPQGYLEKFMDAELTFLHHRVFCPIQQKMVHLTEPDRGVDVDKMPFLGAYVEPDIAIGVACGELNPKTKLPLEKKTTTMGKQLLRANRGPIIGTPNGLKQSKSIETFFTPNRTPLQELDPNSLAPSASQQRLLERHANASWEPRYANSAPQLRRALTESASSSNTSVSDRRSFLAKASTLSSYKPIKRQRLCSEEDVSPSKEVKQSRFFSSTIAPVSPLDQRKGRSRRLKREFDVWSDDSVDDILVGLADVQQLASPQAATSSTNDKMTSDIRSNSEEIDVIPQSSPLKQIEPAVNYEDQDKVEVGRNKTLHDKAISSLGLDVPVGTDDTCLDQAMTTTVTARLSQMQRSGIQASSMQQQLHGHESNSVCGRQHSSREQPANRTSTPPRSNLLKIFIYRSPEGQGAALEDLGQPQSNTEKVELGKAALTQQSPGISSLVSSTTLQGASKVSCFAGSEDALIPNSEDEISEAEDSALRPAFNLRDFIFKA